MSLSRKPALEGLLLAMGIVVVFSLLDAWPARAQTGVIAFRDHCTGLLYAMHGNASGRIALPLPPRPLPTDRYVDPWVLDVTTSGPPTVVYYVGIGRIVVVAGKNVLTHVDYGLFAVQVDEVAGVLTAQPPVRLTLPPVAGVDPNRARRGSFSTAGDRLALVATAPTDGVATSYVLMTAQVERDATSTVIGLSDLVVVGDLLTIGQPNPAFPDSPGFAGFVDYSPGENSIAASMYYDLWLIHLASDNTYLSAEKLTENTDDFAEWNPAFSLDGSRIAHTRTAITRSGAGSSQSHIHSLTLSPRVFRAVTHDKNKGGAASTRDNARWSPDGASIAFTAFTKSNVRRSPCSSLVNSDIFLIPADGSATATQLTNTIGTSVEAWPSWGW